MLARLLGQAVKKVILGDGRLAKTGASKDVVEAAQVVQTLFQRVQQRRRETGVCGDYLGRGHGGGFGRFGEREAPTRRQAGQYGSTGVWVAGLVVRRGLLFFRCLVGGFVGTRLIQELPYSEGSWAGWWWSVAERPLLRLVEGGLAGPVSDAGQVPNVWFSRLDVRCRSVPGSACRVSRLQNGRAKELSCQPAGRKRGDGG